MRYIWLLFLIACSPTEPVDLRIYVENQTTFGFDARLGADARWLESDSMTTFHVEQGCYVVLAETDRVIGSHDLCLTDRSALVIFK